MRKSHGDSVLYTCRVPLWMRQKFIDACQSQGIDASELIRRYMTDTIIASGRLPHQPS